MKIQDLQKLAMVAGAMQKEAISSGMYLQALLNRFSSVANKLPNFKTTGLPFNPEYQEYVQRSLPGVNKYLAKTTPVQTITPKQYKTTSMFPTSDEINEVNFAKMMQGLLAKKSLVQPEDLGIMANNTEESTQMLSQLLNNLKPSLRLPGGQMF